MARQADIGGAGGLPFVKFNECGDTLVGAYGGGHVRQQNDFSTQKPKYKPDGTTPAKELVGYFVAMPGTTAKTGKPEDPQVIDDGDNVRLAFQGYKWGQVIEAQKALPAYSGFKAGTLCSGDVWTIRLIGWSAETANVAAAAKAGFTVVDGRIVLRSQEDKDRYVLAQSRTGGNTNPAKDFEITIRRPNGDEKRWEQAGDELFDSKPWERSTPEPAMAGGGGGGYNPDDDEPF